MHGVRKGNLIEWIRSHPILTTLILLFLVFMAYQIVLFTSYVENDNSNTNCSVDMYDCAEFDSCFEAMNIYTACKDDVHWLDGDGDGVPCEDLCG